MTRPGDSDEELIRSDVGSWLARHESKDMLRFITCGSVDDGKSTLIGRLLYDTRQIFDDQMEALRVESRRAGTRGEELDFALLVDGLSAEREQGITIDVAYRFFTTDKRKFIVADTPGHEQYTRNMTTGASTAELAVLLVDAGRGVLPQTRRHSYICHLLGIRRFVVAITKMDLVDYDEAAFQAIATDYRRFAEKTGIEDWRVIPVSGVNGDNVVQRSDRMPWYRGPSLIEHLETVPLDADADAQKPLRMPVQWVSRPDSSFRGFAGRIEAGGMSPGSAVRILPSGRTTQIERIVTLDGDLQQAVAGQSVTVTFSDALDCSRGDVIAAAADPPEASDQFEATLVWMDEQDLLPGRAYLMKLGTQCVNATVQQPKYELSIETFEHLASKTLGLNAIGVAEIATDAEVVFDPYSQQGSSPNRSLGGFILVDKLTNRTVAAGMINFALRRARNIHRQSLDVSRETHAALKGQKPAVLWFTGLSGSGKSTIANIVEKKLVERGRHTFLLDGDNIRHGLSRDLGFTDADRIENMRRIGEVSRLMADAGLIVLTAFISPFRAEREMVRKMFAKGEFIEVFVDTPLAEAEERDVKGLYAKARAGEIANFTGIDSPYESPEQPEIHIETAKEDAEQAAERIVTELERRGKL